VVVGELPEAIQTDEQMQRCLPQDLLSLRSLATGTDVGAPLIELRKDQGDSGTRRVESWPGRIT
jgi:hypothetical protein